MFKDIGDFTEGANIWDQIFKAEENHRELNSTFDIKSLKRTKIKF